MVRIAHSSINEKGSATGGKKGDQTGKEVCIRNWYNSSWQYVIRFNDPKIGEKAAKIMEAIALNDNIGYCQNTRNTLLAEAEKVNFNIEKIKTPCNCDCSSAVTVALIGAGVPKSALYVWNNCSTTKTLRNNLLKTGMVTVFSTTKYTRSCDQARKGDIYIKEGNHVVMVIDDAPITTKTTSTSTSIQKTQFTIGQQVTLKAGATYTNGKVIPAWVFKSTLYVRRIDNDGIVFSILKTGAITGKTAASNLNVIAEAKTTKVQVIADALNVRKGAGTAYPIIKVIKKDTICEIVNEKNNWGELKDGGWISLKYTKTV